MRMRILKAIEEIQKSQGFPPTVRQIGALVGLSSTDSVQYHIQKLRDSKKVTKNYGRRFRTLLVKS